LSVTYLVPVFAVLYGLLFLGEAVTPWMLICAVVIIVGTAMSTGLLKLRHLLPGPGNCQCIDCSQWADSGFR
jgi:hypothetical protein